MHENLYSVVHLYSLATSKITPVTTSMTNSFAPVFDPDGKYLYFLSDRDFNEVLGNVDFEFSNPKTTRIYVVTLRADEPSPFQPLSDETQIKKEENKDELLVPPGQGTGQDGRQTGSQEQKEERRAEGSERQRQERQR